MIKRFALAVLFAPILLLAISLLGLVFGAIGTVIGLAVRNEGQIQPLGFRLLVLTSAVVVSLVGTLRILTWSLELARYLGRNSPALRQVASDSLLGVVGFGGFVGVTFVAVGLTGIFPGGGVSLLVCGTALVAAAASILIPRLRRTPKRTPPADPPPSGALASGIPNVPESTSARAVQVAGGAV